MSAEKILRFFVFSSLFTLVLACAEGENSVARRDSAGITIVESADVGKWAATDVPHFEEVAKIGGSAADTLYQFGRIAGLDIGSDGSVYVLDQQLQKVRVYDATGSYVRTIGRAGGGPGELSPAALGVFVGQGDTVLIPDVGAQRVSIFNASADLITSVPMQVTEGIAAKVVEVRDQALVFQMRVMNMGSAVVVSDPADYLVERAFGGAAVDTILKMPLGGTVSFGGGGGQFSMKIFAPEPIWTIGEDRRVFYGLNSEYSINAFDSDGTLKTIIRRGVTRVPVTEELKGSVIDLMKEAARAQGAPEAALEQLSSAITFAEYFPAFGNLLVGPGGTLWVQRIRNAEEMAALGAGFNPQRLGSPNWEVFDAEGVYQGVVTTPEGFTPLSWAGDLLLGIWLNDLDVNHAMVLKLVGM